MSKEEEEGRGRRSKSSEEEIQTLSEERTDLELATNDFGGVVWCLYDKKCVIYDSGLPLEHRRGPGEDVDGRSDKQDN